MKIMTEKLPCILPQHTVHNGTNRWFLCSETQTHLPSPTSSSCWQLCELSELLARNVQTQKISNSNKNFTIQLSSHFVWKSHIGHNFITGNFQHSIHQGNAWGSAQVQMFTVDHVLQDSFQFLYHLLKVWNFYLYTHL